MLTQDERAEEAERRQAPVRHGCLCVCMCVCACACACVEYIIDTYISHNTQPSQEGDGCGQRHSE
jgi:hypothetical protein